jgi:psp operon transcriptional activator
MKSNMETYQKSLTTPSSRNPGEALGQSQAFLDFQDRLSQVAPVNRPVLILGERGTGKELAAARLHYLSQRWQGPLVALNCAALAPSLLEAELFGHERGAFTGAVQMRSGRFEAAHGGTLFLDEIGTLPLEVQEKILRVVEYGCFERVGSSKTTEVDVRILAATNADVKELASAGKFKQDLLDRLSFEVLYLPPLRMRNDDILLLARHFAARMAFELDFDEIPRFTRFAEKALKSYDWPGNIRELKNVVERAVYRSENSVIETISFDPFDSPFATQTGAQKTPWQGQTMSLTEEDDFSDDLSLKEAVWALKVRFLENALTATKFNQTAAARKLGLTYHQFRGLYRQYQAFKQKQPLKKS